jgi:hypothetical protein
VSTRSRPSLRRAGSLLVRHVGLAAAGRLRTVPIETVTDEFAFALASSGWNYYTDLLAQVQARPGLQLEDSTFYRFFTHPTTNAVRDLNDLLDLGREGGTYQRIPRFWLGTYPWGGLLRGDVGGAGPAYGRAYDEVAGADTSTLWGAGRNLWYEPRDRFTLGTEWDLTIQLRHSIAGGYRPVRARGFPRVTELRRGRERRRVIVDGHHRLAALAHLGARTVTVERESVVDRAQARSWYHVRSGRCTVAEAQVLFDAFFDLDGSERRRLPAGEIRARCRDGR